MVEIHYIRDDDGSWWAYTKNDRDYITAVAHGKTQGKARARLFKQFGAVDYVDGLVNRRIDRVLIPLDLLPDGDANG